MHVKVLIHFFINECQPLYMFYLGWYSVVTSAATFDRGMVPSRLELAPMDPDDYRACMTADVGKACFSFMQKIHGKCIDFDANPWGYLNLSGLILTVVMIFNMMCHLLLERRALKARGIINWTYTSGHYLSFTFKMRAKRWYKSFAYILLSYTALAAVYVFYHGLLNPKYVMGFLTGQVPSLLLCGYSAYSLTVRHESVFAMGNEKFQSLNFKRSCMGIFTQSNHSLADTVEQAAFHAFNKQYHQIEEIVDFKNSGFQGSTRDERMQEALAALHPKKKLADVHPTENNAGADLLAC